MKASFKVAQKIIRSKKLHNIVGGLIRSAAIATTKTICGKNVAKQLDLIQISNDAIKRLVDLIAEIILTATYKKTHNGKTIFHSNR